MILKNNIIRLFPILFFLFFLPLSVFAADSSLPVIQNPFDSLQVKIPGMAKFSEAQVTKTDDKTKIYINWIAEYLVGFYKYAIAIIGVFAVVGMAIGGVIWIMSGGNPGMVAMGREWVMSSLLGLVLALGSYIILNSINSEFVNFKPLTLDYVDRIGEADPYSTDAYSGGYDMQGRGIGTNIMTKGQDCFYDNFGRSSSEVNANMTTVNCPALGGSVRVHKLAAEAFAKVCAKIPLGLKTICGKPLSASCQNWRMVRGSSTSRSLHSWAIACDINGFGCGECDNRARINGQCPCRVIFPNWVTQAFKSTPGFRWGGDYRTKCDNMHFEWLGPCQK